MKPLIVWGNLSFREEGILTKKKKSIDFLFMQTAQFLSICYYPLLNHLSGKTVNKKEICVCRRLAFKKDIKLKHNDLSIVC